MLSSAPSTTVLLKQQVRFRLGQLGSIALPTRKSSVLKSFSVPQFHNSSRLKNKLDSWIHYYLVQSKIRNEPRQIGLIESAHKTYWANSAGYFDQFAHLAQESYIPVYQDVVRDLAPLIKKMGIKTVAEFGTGDGQWLDYLTTQWSFITQFTGIDISASQIAKNRLVYPQLTFEEADLVKWAEQHAAPHSLFHTNGGVLEYLSEQSVRRLLAVLKKQARGSIVFFNEPVYDDFDYSTDKTSRVVGSEFTYNHNLEYLFAESGIKLMRCEGRDAFGYRMVFVIGTT